MSSNIEKSVEKLSSIFRMVDEVLNTRSSDKNLQIPDLLQMLAVKENWDEKQTREADPLVRYYIRNYSGFDITRGAHGGIKPKKLQKEKEEMNAIKAALKEEIESELEENK